MTFCGSCGAVPDVYTKACPQCGADDSRCPNFGAAGSDSCSAGRAAATRKFLEACGKDKVWVWVCPDHGEVEGARCCGKAFLRGSIADPQAKDYRCPCGGPRGHVPNGIHCRRGV